jgi:hypothetical protein
MGELFIETKKYFTKTNLDFIQSNPIFDNSDFHKTTQLRNRIKEESNQVISLLNPEEQNEFNEQFGKLIHMGNCIVNIYRK